MYVFNHYLTKHPDFINKGEETDMFLYSFLPGGNAFTVDLHDDQQMPNDTITTGTERALQKLSGIINICILN